MSGLPHKRLARTTFAPRVFPIPQMKDGSTDSDLETPQPVDNRGDRLSESTSLAPEEKTDNGAHES